MPDSSPEFLSYAIQQSDKARQSRKELPPETLLRFSDIIDELAENPEAFPGRTQTISRDGSIRVYSHPSPALQVTFEIDTEKRILYLLHFVAPKVQITKPVFISYCHKDAEWLGKLKMFLRPLEVQGLLRVWDDNDIRAGSDWLEEIQRSLECARVAVFLITQNFLNSEFISENELPKLLEQAKNRGCLIFWVAVSSSTVQDSGLAQFQAANDPNQPLDTLSESEQNRVLAKIYKKMKDAVEGV